MAETSKPDDSHQECQAPLAITMGDPAGIGPDITLAAWQHRNKRLLPRFALYACPECLHQRARELRLDIPIKTIEKIGDATDVFASALPIIPIPLAKPAEAGSPDTQNATAILSSIEQAAIATDNGSAAAIVTNPISKAVLYKSGFNHPGHTEYLASLAAKLRPSADPTPVMMLASEELRVVPLTIHIPLEQVPASITANLIEKTVRILADALRSDFQIAEPRIAVSGLNPHAGEGGAIGSEETQIITPTLDRLRQQGYSISGPHPADTMFHAEARINYDAAIAMYHDQALIPIKTLAFDRGVNTTLGLPFVRTSPDHGTAFAIAGRNIASPESLIQAIKLAGRMAAARNGASSK